MADYLADDGNLPRPERGHGKERKSPTFTKLESLAKRAAFQAETYGKDETEKFLLNLDKTAEDTAAHVAEAVQAMTHLVRSTPVARLRSIVPQIREIETLYHKQSIAVTPEDKKHISDTATTLIQFIEEKTTLFARIKSSLGNVVREHEDAFLKRAAESSSVLLSAGARAIQRRTNPKPDEVEQERLNVRAQVAQRIVSQNQAELGNDNALSEEPKTTKGTKGVSRGEGSADVQAQILEVDHQILAELKKENENWEQDKEGQKRAADEGKKDKPAPPERIRAVKENVKTAGIFDSLVGGIGDVFKFGLSAFEKLFEFSALKSILGGLKIGGGGPQLPSPKGTNVPKPTNIPSVPGAPGMWTKMRNIPGLPTTGVLATEVGAGVSAAAIAGAAVVGGVIGQELLAPATKDNSNATKRAINRYGFDVFQYGGAWWGEQLGILPPGSAVAAAATASAENKTVFAQAPPPKPAAPKPMLNGQHPEAHIGAAPSKPVKMPSVPHMSAAEPGTALPPKPVRTSDKIVGIESVGAGFLVAKLSDGSTVKRTGPMNWRNNNPGNLRFSDWSKAHGAIGDANGYAVFPDVETGRKARETLLFEGKTRQHYDQLTVSKMIEVYAPPSENPTAAYQKYVLSALNGRDVKLADMNATDRDTLMASMEKFEGFKTGNVAPTRAALPDNATGEKSNIIIAPVVQTNVGGSGSGGGSGMIIPAAPMTTRHPDETLQAMRRTAPLD